MAAGSERSRGCAYTHSCSILQPALLRRVPQETGQAPGCSSPSLRANPGSALTNNGFCLQEAGYRPLPVSASCPAQTHLAHRAPIPPRKALCRAGDEGQAAGQHKRRGAGSSTSQALGRGRQGGRGADPAYLIQIVEKALEERGEG